MLLENRGVVGTVERAIVTLHLNVIKDPQIVELASILNLNQSLFLYASKARRSHQLKDELINKKITIFLFYIYY